MWLKPFKGGSHQGKNLLSIYSSYSTNSLKNSSNYWYFSALKYFYPLIWSLKKQKIGIKQSYLKTTRATTKTTDRFLYHLFQPERGITKTTPFPSCHQQALPVVSRYVEEWTPQISDNEMTDKSHQCDRSLPHRTRGSKSVLGKESSQCVNPEFADPSTSIEL